MVYIRIFQQDKIDLQADKHGLVPLRELLAYLHLSGSRPLRSFMAPGRLVYTVQRDELQRVANESEQVTEFKRNLQLRSKQRQYQRLLHGKNKHYQFFNKPDGVTIKDYQKSLSFAMTFIFSFFASGLSGYYLGQFMGLSREMTLVLAFLLIIATIVMQTTLFILKSSPRGARGQERERKMKSE